MLRHKGLIAVFLLMFVMVLVPFVHADDENDSHARIVRVSYVEGQVQVAYRQAMGYENATLNVPLAEGDQVRTGDDGWVEIELEDGSTIRLAPESQIVFSSLSRYASGGAITVVDLNDGEAEFKVAAHDHGMFRVNVRQRSLVLKHSSRFRVTTTNSDPLELVVWTGEVGVANPDDAVEVAVKKNESFVLDPMDAGRYDLEQSPEADDLDQWTLQREDYLSRYAVNAGDYYTQSPYQYGLSDLSYYGNYLNVPGYGYCWQPSGVNVGWDPYSNGYWNYAPGFGYTWVSAYPWGWMPYRYGRWVFVNGFGWVWQPGLWNRWVSGPRFVNPPAGFRAPVPPKNNVVVQKFDGGPARLTVQHPLVTTPGRQGRPVISNENAQAPVPMDSPEFKRTVPLRQGSPAPVNSQVVNNPPATTSTNPPVERFHRVPPVENRVVNTPPAQQGVVNNPPATTRTDPPGQQFHRMPPVENRVVNTPPVQQRVVNNPPPPVTRTVMPPPPPVHLSPPPQQVISRPSPPPQPVRTFTPPPPPPASHGDAAAGRKQR